MQFQLRAGAIAGIAGGEAAVEGRCKKCGLYKQAAFKLHSYMRMVNKAYPNGVIIITCPACKKDGSVEFPMLI
jgi:DNL zinc finger